MNRKLDYIILLIDERRPLVKEYQGKLLGKYFAGYFSDGKRADKRA